MLAIQLCSRYISTNIFDMMLPSYKACCTMISRQAMCLALHGVNVVLGPSELQRGGEEMGRKQVGRTLVVVPVFASEPGAPTLAQRQVEALPTLTRLFVAVLQH